MKPRFRTLRQTLYRLSGRRSVTLDGVRVHALGEGIPLEVTRLLQRGDYEFAERYLLKQVARPGDRVLEVGAGIGVLGLVAARICGASNVLSYEANPATLPLIEANQSLNGLHPGICAKAITVGGGPITFFRSDNIISSSLLERTATNAMTVESDRFDTVMENFAPTILLMDAEGAELQLLPSADLSGLRAIVVETHAKITGKAPVDALRADLVAQGFTIVTEANNNMLCLRDLQAPGHGA